MISIIHTWKKPHKFTSSTQYIVHIDADGRERKNPSSWKNEQESWCDFFIIKSTVLCFKNLSLQWIGDKSHFKIQLESNTSKSGTKIVGEKSSNSIDAGWGRWVSYVNKISSLSLALHATTNSVSSCEGWKRWWHRLSILTIIYPKMVNYTLQHVSKQFFEIDSPIDSSCQGCWPSFSSLCWCQDKAIKL